MHTLIQQSLSYSLFLSTQISESNINKLILFLLCFQVNLQFLFF